MKIAKIFSKILFFFVFLTVLAVPATLEAQTDFRRLSESEAAGVLAGFRASRLAGDFCMKFNITHYLRKSDEAEYCTGTLFGTWTDSGPILRLEIASAAAPATKKKFILRGGKSPELWTLGDDGKPVRVDGNATEPFFENLIFTPFELQTPFVYWENAVYEQTKRYRGRPVHFFKMTPPADFCAVHPEIGFVRIGFDRVYNALIFAEIYGADGRSKKSFSLSGVQKVQEQYTIRELELRDNATRDKDEFSVYAAALGLTLPREAFEPDALAEPAPDVPAARFSHL